jgi:hypothetical protein
MVLRMAETKKSDTRHITAHHLWAYLHANPATELSKAEHDHILHCDACSRLFMLCLKSDTFGSVLKALAADFDGRRCG